MNHLEQLVAEWLQYNDYFVRCSIQVGPRARGGFEGELDVVGIHMVHNHLIHVECSLDADSWDEREVKFARKFERGARFMPEVFTGMPLHEFDFEQVAVLQFRDRKRRVLGGGRLLSVRELVREIAAGLAGTSPLTGAVPSNLPLLRTLQLAADAQLGAQADHRLIAQAKTP